MESVPAPNPRRTGHQVIVAHQAAACSSSSLEKSRTTVSEKAFPEWEDRDRIVWSGGHKARALYFGLGFTAYYPLQDAVTLRKLYSPFQGHQHRLKLPGVEASTGSL